MSSAANPTNAALAQIPHGLLVGLNIPRLVSLSRPDTCKLDRLECVMLGAHMVVSQNKGTPI